MDEIETLKAENEALRERLAHYEIGEIPNLRDANLDERQVNEQLRNLVRKAERGL